MNKWMGKSWFFIDFFKKSSIHFGEPALIHHTNIFPSLDHHRASSHFLSEASSQALGFRLSGVVASGLTLFCFLFFFPLLMIYMLGIWKGNFWNLNIFLLFQSTTLTLRTLIRNNGAGRDCLFFVGRCRKKLYIVKKEANKRRKSLDILTQIECFQDIKYLGFNLSNKHYLYFFFPLDYNCFFFFIFFFFYNCFLVLC